MRLSSFIGGIFGIVGFALSILGGLIADNPFNSILLKALLWAAVCYLVGYGVGLIAQQVSTEHAQRLAKRVADSDALREQQEAQERAEREATAAARNSGETLAAAPLVPGKA